MIHAHLADLLVIAGQQSWTSIVASFLVVAQDLLVIA